MQVFFNNDRCLPCVNDRIEDCVREPNIPSPNNACTHCRRKNANCVRRDSRPAVVLPTRGKAPATHSGAPYPTTAEEWAAFMADTLGRWEQKFEALGETIRNATFASADATSTVIADAVAGIVRETATAREQVEQYAAENTAAVARMSEKYETVNELMDRISQEMKDAQDDLLDLAESSSTHQGLLHSQSVALTAMARDIHILKNNAILADARYDFLFNAVNRFGQRLHIDVGQPREPLFLPSPEPSSPPSGSQGQIEKLIGRGEDDEMGSSDRGE
ncbi:hypothetical protein PUNSTDRAFT_130389 [Punctularia strigosozonata HHB-11173 SS5]|uniref:uncharacterized protein n=1 Tax=Punctularia strigosozonata (strain HHB-11173) TaxID=741275 RepID=UPI00044170B3|nr:uncharacterized protein PUNSTDRAFT_130389 [Punctularia strigosozonata HHB-11173 SS5]EIN12116.1 hypothetical protein PUNSTDRAFT_130389 [Punctularia strigosozonata HHB-11173 SS5]